MRLKEQWNSDRHSYDEFGGRSDTDLRTDDPEALAVRIFALSEPWRGRFVGFIAHSVGYRNGHGAGPTQAQVATWLRDRRLFRQVKTMVDTWT